MSLHRYGSQQHFSFSNVMVFRRIDSGASVARATPSHKTALSKRDLFEQTYTASRAGGRGAATQGARDRRRTPMVLWRPFCATLF